MCSRFRGSCPSDVKSAVHPESGFPISLSVFTAALCAPREIQKNPVTRGVPVYRPRFQGVSRGHTKPPGRTLSECDSLLWLIPYSLTEKCRKMPDINLDKRLRPQYDNNELHKEILRGRVTSVNGRIPDRR